MLESLQGTALYKLMCVSGREGCFKTAHKVYGFPEHDKKIQHLNKKILYMKGFST